MICVIYLWRKLDLRAFVAERAWIRITRFLRKVIRICLRYKESYMFYLHCNTWHMIQDMWHLALDIWHVTPDAWHVTHDFFLCPFLPVLVLLQLSAHLERFSVSGMPDFCLVVWTSIKGFFVLLKMQYPTIVLSKEFFGPIYIRLYSFIAILKLIFPPLYILLDILFWWDNIWLKRTRPGCNGGSYCLSRPV